MEAFELLEKKDLIITDLISLVEEKDLSFDDLCSFFNFGFDFDSINDNSSLDFLLFNVVKRHMPISDVMFFEKIDSSTIPIVRGDVQILFSSILLSVFFNIEGDTIPIVLNNKRDVVLFKKTDYSNVLRVDSIISCLSSVDKEELLELNKILKAESFYFSVYDFYEAISDNKTSIPVFAKKLFDAKYQIA